MKHITFKVMLDVMKEGSDLFNQHTIKYEQNYQGKFDQIWLKFGAKEEPNIY